MKNQALPSANSDDPSPSRMMSRRRCLTLFASAAALPLSAHAGQASTHTWNGHAFGGDVSLTLDGFTATDSADLINRAVQELDRLEDVFSLYRPTSALTKLNMEGVYADAPQDLRDALDVCRDLHERSNGAFDPSVQRLWSYYDAESGGSARGQAADPDFADALASVGFSRIKMSGGDITLPRGVCLTLNGIAQGIATDRVTDLFRAAGARHTLINLGEFRALGPKADGSPWQIGLRDPDAVWRLRDVVQIKGGALATSAGSGYRFQNGHHLLDPKSGTSASHFSSVSVIAPTATLADGLSTALYVLPLENAWQLVDQFENVGALFMLPDGRTITTKGWQAT